jgi:hypothetical protein
VLRYFPDLSLSAIWWPTLVVRPGEFLKMNVNEWMCCPRQPGKRLSTSNELSLERPRGHKSLPHFTLGFNRTEGSALAIS